MAKTLRFRTLCWLVLGLLAVVVLALLLAFVLRSGFRFSIDYNEGWNVYHSLDVASGRLLYDRQSEWTPVDYPPLSFYFVGAIGKLLGDPLLAGRYISLLSLLLISIGIGHIVRQLGGEVYDALFAGVFCLGLFVVYAPHYVGMNDPQMLAQLFIVGGLIIYLQDEARLFPVALLCSLGLFTKHNVLSFPVVVTIDLFLRSRRDFFKWIGYLALTMGGLFLLTQAIAGPSFLDQLTMGRGYTLQKVRRWVRTVAGVMLLPLLITLPWLFHAMQKGDRSRIIPMYLVVSLSLGVFFSGGSGADINMFFDTFLGLSIAAGMSFSYLRTTLQPFVQKPHLVSFILSIALAAAILVGLRGQTIGIESYHRFQDSEQAFLEDADFVRSKSGPGLCQNILLCYFAGKSFEYDTYLDQEMMLSGRVEESRLLGQLESGYFGVVQLTRPLPDRYLRDAAYGPVKKEGAFTENFFRALARHYTLTRTSSNGAFYVPNNSGGSDRSPQELE